jgi:hypothetical protein
MIFPSITTASHLATDYTWPPKGVVQAMHLFSLGTGKKKIGGKKENVPGSNTEKG